MDLPAEAGSATADVPALLVRIRPLGVDLPCPDDLVFRATAVLDTGAAVSSIPMWSLRRLGTAPDEGTRQAAFGAQGGFQACGTRIGMEIEHDRSWLDIGVMDAPVPDTARPRDPEFRLPFLLGRRGFFDKFDMRISESQQAVWSAGSAGGRAPARRRDDAGRARPAAGTRRRRRRTSRACGPWIASPWRPVAATPPRGAAAPSCTPRPPWRPVRSPRRPFRRPSCLSPASPTPGTPRTRRPRP